MQRIGRIPSVIIGAVFSAACVAPLGLSTSAWQLAALWTLAAVSVLGAVVAAARPRHAHQRAVQPEAVPS